MAFNDYLNDLRKLDLQLLTADEEHDLGVRIKQGDMDARAELIEANLPLVINIAKRYKNKYVPIDDLVQEGNLGLMRAADKFDPDRGCRFSTCAVPWITQRIHTALNNNGRSIKLPAHIHQKLEAWRKAYRTLTNNYHREPTDAEMATFLGVEVDEVCYYSMWNYATTSIDTPVGEDDNITIGDMIEDHSATPAELAEDGIKEAFVHKMLTRLPERTQAIMRYYYGVDGENARHSFEEVGQLLVGNTYDGKLVTKPLSRERVRQIANEATTHLKAVYGNKEFLG